MSMLKICGQELELDLFDADVMEIYEKSLDKVVERSKEAKKHTELLRTLSSDLEFCKIMEYRSVDINANMTKEQRDFYRRKKELYALPLPADEEEKVDAIAEALMNGGDLTGLL